MKEIYTKYGPQGLEILAFPCNQFGGQEPGTNAQIKQYATTKYHATYPLMAKVDVNGEKACEAYKYLRRNSELYNAETKQTTEIPWNFAKFLVNPEGKVVKYWNSRTDPNECVSEIEKML